MKKEHQENQQQEENGSIFEILKTNPFVLEINSDVIKAAKYLLPYSTGFEIECLQGEQFEQEYFDSISNIIESSYDDGEQRFRIPKGIKGLRCLYTITKLLQKYSILADSGIHYHVDCTDFYNKITTAHVKKSEEWILKRLDKWNYEGNYNKRRIELNSGHNWVRFQNTFKTMEFRIGEMTFDYSLISKRIIDANDIVRSFKEIIERGEINTTILKYNNDINDTLNNRVQRL